MICTLDNPVYLTRVKGKTVHCLDRSARPRTITFDPTEYRFKLALLKNNYEEMLYIIKTSTLLGQSIIAYLQQKGFPEVYLNICAFISLFIALLRSLFTLCKTRTLGLNLRSNVEILMSQWRRRRPSIAQTAGRDWLNRLSSRVTTKSADSLFDYI